MITNQKNREAQQQRRVELYARLTSLPSLDTLKAKEKTALVALAKQGGYALLDSADIMRKPPKWHQRAEKEWEKRKPSLEDREEIEKVFGELREATFEEMMQAAHLVNLTRTEKRGELLPTYWDAIRVVQPYARQLMNDLLSKGITNLPPSEFSMPSVLVLKENYVSAHYRGANAREEILFDFLQTIRLTPFPFRQCPRCHAIFPRSRKQKFCSLSCRGEAFSYTENPKRQTQVKKAVERFRKKRKKLAKQKMEEESKR